MKALNYLQKVGAIPDYNTWDLAMSLVVITRVLFGKEYAFTIDPSEVPWVHGENGDSSKERSECAFYGVSGDVRALFPHICNKDSDFLMELIKSLLEARVALHRVSESYQLKLDDRDFVNSYNEMIGLTGNKKFPTKSSIFHHFFNGSFTDVGQEILSEIAGTKDDFRGQVSKINKDFLDFVYREFSAEITKTEMVFENGNPFEGGHQVKVSLRVPGAEEEEDVTLHWAPWPSAKTSSVRMDVIGICNRFNASQKEEWFTKAVG